MPPKKRTRDDSKVAAAAKIPKVDTPPPLGPSCLDSTYTIDDTWISASQTRNYLMKDPLLDYLQRYPGSISAKNKAYNLKISQALSGRSNDTFTDFIMAKGLEFEAHLLGYLRHKFSDGIIVDIGGGLSRGKSIDKVRETLAAMNKGVPIIYSGVLHDTEHKTYGVADLIVRSDWLKELVKKSPISAADERISAPRLTDVHDPSKPPAYHYRIVDIKFSTLYLRSDGKHLLAAGSQPAFKAQLWVYTQALAKLQGYDPTEAYLLGRKWKFTKMHQTFKGKNCLDVLGTIAYATDDKETVVQTLKALEWNRVVREKGDTWKISDELPLARPELYPNMSFSRDHPWHGIKDMIADEIKEITDLWQCGPRNREVAHKNGVMRWTDPRCTAELLDVRGEVARSILNKILAINRQPEVHETHLSESGVATLLDENGDKIDLVRPQYLAPYNDTIGWQVQNGLEFFVDFETSNDVLTDFSKLPYVESSSMIFMIGVGHYRHYISEDGERSKRWVFKVFTIDLFAKREEERICSEFSAYIREESKLERCLNPLIFHWASAEKCHWKSAVERHGGMDKAIDRGWIFTEELIAELDAPPRGDNFQPRWCDMLKVFKTEPIVVKGCLGFSLKEVAKALHSHHLIETTWDSVSSCGDGVGAMLGAYRASQDAKMMGITMRESVFMREIVRYNEVDTRTLAEIVEFLRNNHIERVVADDSTEEIRIEDL